MKKFFTIILSLLLCLALCAGLTGCTEVEQVTYTVEDVSGANVDKYFYEFNINPRLYRPFVDPTYID